MSTTLRRVRLIFAAAALMLGGDFAAIAGPVASLVDDQKMQGAPFDMVAPFASSLRIATDASRTGTALREVVADGRVLSLDVDALTGIRRDRPQTMAFELPAKSGNLTLELVRVDPFGAGFKVVTSDGTEVPKGALGVHYRGVVRGEAGSLASISVFDREISGFVQTKGDHLVLGRLGGENPRNRHIVYAEGEMVPKNHWKCETEATEFSAATGEEMLSYFDASHSEGLRNFYAAAQRPVRIYVETDYDMYQRFGSSAAVTSYVSGVFAQSATLYNNESIPIVASQYFVWTSRSPYKGNSSSQLLAGFQKTRKTFNGDLGHLVALRGGGGIAAGFNGFCAANRRDSQCFSMLDDTYNNVPVYSWSVMVFTHEMGHLMGSRHTHACVWNGNNTQIDGCYNPEGTCARLGYPAGGGTVMSYCHLQSVGINFQNGFGPQPGNLIRSRYNGASCLAQ